MPLQSDGYTDKQIPGLGYDINATSSFKLDMPPNGEITLQFPPKITSDNKSSRWEEKHNAGYEEYAYWMGAYARKIGIELLFVVWGEWTGEKISDTIRLIKDHLYVSGPKAPPDKLPFFFINGWRMINDPGDESPAYRLIDMSVDYSREYVGKDNDWWPLQTKISMNCKLISQAGAGPGDPKYREKGYNGETLPTHVLPIWR